MLFNSLSFAIFLPIVFVLYWALPHRYRWLLILVSGYYFYMSWNVKYVVLILFTTISSYLAARLMEKTTAEARKKLILAGTVVLCLGPLVLFKYFNFLSESVTAFLSLFTIKLNPVTADLLLPIGISFYTFQTLSYVIDVYRGDIEAEHHFGYYAAYISFFPQLVAGPIERAANLLPQIRKEHYFDYDQAAYGLKLMAWGFFKKIVIADSLSYYVQAVYEVPHNYHGFALVLATLLFVIQIYCDFSGYSDIAIGTAKLMGIDLMTNFKSPLFSQSISELWSRWHISLSTWFRDYVYFPLGGNRVGKFRHALNVMITFLLSGLWHGANWTFVFWGGIHGVAQLMEQALIPKQKMKSSGALKWIRILLVMTIFSFSMIFFRSDSYGDAFYVITHLFTGIASPINYLHDGFATIGMSKSTLMTMLFSVLILACYDYISLKKDVIKWISEKKTGLRWVIYISFMLMIVFLSDKGIGREFIYFQF